MSKPKTTQEYEAIGKAVSAIYETGYLDENRSYKQSFIKGLYSGLGGALGATILVALLLWILSLFSSFPLVGRFVIRVQDTITSHQATQQK